MNFANIRNEQIIDMNSNYLDSDITTVEVTDDIYNIWKDDKDKVIYKDGEVIIDPDYEEKKKQAERERLDKLSMTRGDVFEALILAKGLVKAQLRSMIEQAELDTVTKALYLNRFDEALEFYRGYPIFDMLGEALDITPSMLDKFFDKKDYHYLTKCKLTINATPADAVIVGAGSYPYGTTVDYKVELEGYKPYVGSVELLEDTVLNIELEKIEEVVDEDTTDTEPTTDVSNEVEAEPTGDANADKD